MACITQAPVTAFPIGPKVLLRSISASCSCQLKDSYTSCISWNVTHAKNGRSTIRGEYDGLDLPSSQSSRNSSYRTKIAASPVGSVASIYRKDAVDLVQEPLQKPQPVAKPKADYTVREAKLDEELWAAAWIRAEAYCEDQPYVRSPAIIQKWNKTGPESQVNRPVNSRYIDSYKKNFAEQEFDALKRRLMGKYGHSIKCICFVTVMEKPPRDSSIRGCETTTMESVVGTLDLSVRQLSQGEAFPGDSVRASLSSGEQRSQRYGYVSNVCVTKAARRKGIGSSLLQEAIKCAKSWELKELFVHVSASNKIASHLYSKHKFEVVLAEAAQVGLNNVILLKREI